MTYLESGVDYSAMDPFKLACQQRARPTDRNIERFGLTFVPGSRGESVQLVYGHVASMLHPYFGHVEEGLGTKSLVADAMYAQGFRSFYDNIAKCTVAMIVNDMVTLGVLPVTVAMHLAVAESGWFGDRVRSGDLINGWGDACDLARCVWSGGETPTLQGLIVPGTALLSGSAFGMVKRGHSPFDPANIAEGDAIVVVESSGIHANGLTLARRIAEQLPRKYLTELPDGRTYGEHLLDATHIYLGVVEDCVDAGVRVHYTVNITGHGARKFMRAHQPWTYVIDTLPTQLQIFDFLQERGFVTDQEAYGNLNMGMGFALFVPSSDVQKVVAAASALGQRAFLAGHIEAGPKRVVIRPKGIEFAANTLVVR